MKMHKEVTSFAILILFLFTCKMSVAQKKELPVGGEQRIILKKIDNNPFQEYSSTIDFTDSRKQLVMAGQNYQTNYGIYAKIEMVNSVLGEEYRTLKNIDFEIVNYKPTYFIGIDSVVVSTTRALDGLTFIIYTRALSDKSTYNLGKNELKNIHFENGSYLHSERILNPMFPEINESGFPVLLNDGRIACKPDNGKAFDFEFFYKDGRLVVRKEDYDKEDLNKVYNNEIASTLPGKRCSSSFNKIMF